MYNKNVKIKEVEQKTNKVAGYEAVIKVQAMDRKWGGSTSVSATL